MYNVKWVCRDERNGVPFIRSRTANILLAEKTTNRMFVVRKKGNISIYSDTPLYILPGQKCTFLSFWQNYFSFSFKNEVFSEKCAEINEKLSIKINMNFSDQTR